MRERVNLADIRDHAAAQELRRHIDAVVAELASMQQRPAIVAACPYKFNDVGNDSGWRALQVGRFVAERADFYDPPQAYDMRLAHGPPEGRRANTLIDRLETADWRGLCARCFGLEMSHEQVLGVVLQEGSPPLFVLCASNDGEDAVYTLPAEGGFRLIGRPISSDDWRRFDQRFGEVRPLILRTFEQDAADRTAAIALIEEFERRPGVEPPPPPEPEPDRIVTDDKGLTYRVYTMGMAVPREDSNPLYRRAQALRETQRINQDEHRQILDLLMAAGESP